MSLHKPAIDTAAVSTFLAGFFNLLPTIVSVVGGVLFAAYYCYLIYDKWDQRRKRQHG